jgi:hypothetical protein
MPCRSSSLEGTDDETHLTPAVRGRLFRSPADRLRAAGSARRVGRRQRRRRDLLSTEFRIEGVAAGNYILSFEHDDLVAASATITVHAGRPITDLEVLLFGGSRPGESSVILHRTSHPRFFSSGAGPSTSRAQSARSALAMVATGSRASNRVPISCAFDLDSSRSFGRSRYRNE